MIIQRNRIWLLIAGILAMVLLGSASFQQSGVFRTWIDQGITYTHWSGASLFQGEIFQYEKIIEYKQDPNRPTSYLEFPQKVVKGPNNTFLVLDLRGNRIVVFDDSGRFVKSIGRPGHGPGELMMPITLEYRRGAISTYSYQQQRLTAYNDEGNFIGSLTAPSEVKRMNQYLEFALRDTILVHEQSGSSEKGPRYSVKTVNIYDRTWQQIASVSTPSVRVGTMAPIIDFTSDYLMATTLPFSGNPILVYSGDMGIMVTTGDESKLSFYSLSGGMTDEYSFEIPREKVSRAERRQIRNDHNQRLQTAIEGGYLLVIARAKTESQNLEFPEEKAYWVSAIVDNLGFIWLELPSSDVSNRDEGYVPWMLVSPIGEYLGITQCPILIGVSISSDMLIGLEIDPDTDEMIPVAYRIVGNFEGLGR